MTVKLSNEQEDCAVDEAHIARLALHALAVEGADEEAELSVAFIDEGRMAEINERYTGHEGPTDVLAFPLDEDEEESGAPSEEPQLLGDVVICPAVAARHAAEYESSTEAEMSLLLVHGVLHLLGYDHASDDEAAAMRRREAKILETFNPGGGQ